jgi:hypothetical protein
MPDRRSADPLPSVHGSSWRYSSAPSQGRCQGANEEFFSIPSFGILVSEKSKT